MTQCSYTITQWYNAYILLLVVADVGVSVVVALGTEELAGMAFL